MQKPHHKKYYQYFDQRKFPSIENDKNKMMSMLVIMRKLKDKRLSVREYHFFFKKFKCFIGLDGVVKSGSTFLKHQYQADPIFSKYNYRPRADQNSYLKGFKKFIYKRSQMKKQEVEIA